MGALHRRNGAKKTKGERGNVSFAIFPLSSLGCFLEPAPSENIDRTKDQMNDESNFIFVNQSRKRSVVRQAIEFVNKEL